MRWLMGATAAGSVFGWGDMGREAIIAVMGVVIGIALHELWKATKSRMPWTRPVSPVKPLLFHGRAGDAVVIVCSADPRTAATSFVAIGENAFLMRWITPARKEAYGEADLVCYSYGHKRGRASLKRAGHGNLVEIELNLFGEPTRTVPLEELQ